jgi:PTS system nitrogen regulatory IIA component
MMRDDKMHTALSEAPGDEAMYALIANAIDRGPAQA